MPSWNWDRTKKLTAAEFKALPRNTDGDIIDLFPAFAWFTKAQTKTLTGDDAWRVDEYEEEVRYEIAAELDNV